MAIPATDREDFDRWLTAEVARDLHGEAPSIPFIAWVALGLHGEAPSIPFIAWGPQHTEVAVRYAKYALSRHRCALPEHISEALNQLTTPAEVAGATKAARHLGSLSVKIVEIAAQGPQSSFNDALVRRSEIMMDCAKVIKEWAEWAEKGGDL